MHADVTFDQFASTAPGAAVTTYTLPNVNTSTTTELMLLAITEANGTAITTSPTGVSSWTFVTAATLGTSVRTELWCSTSTAQIVNGTITIALPSSVKTTAIVNAYRGANINGSCKTISIDVSTNTSASGSSTPASRVTTVSNRDLMAAFVGQNSNQTVTAGTGFTLAGSSNSTTVGEAAEYDNLLVTPPALQGSSFTFGGAAAYSEVAVGIKPPGAPPTNPLISAVYLSSMTATWGSVSATVGYQLQASTGVWFSSNSYTGNASSATPSGTATTLSLNGGALFTNTTYYLEVGSLWAGGTNYALSTPTSSSTLTTAVSGSQVYKTFFSSVTLNWLPLPTTPSSSTCEGYLVLASTSSNFLGTVYSSQTANVSLSTLTVIGLPPSTAMYFEVGSVNWNNVANYSTSVSTSIGCSMITSVGSTAWSSAATWNVNSVPTACNAVTIAAATTVTVDITNATASTMTVNGTLSFSRVASSTLTIVGGSLAVNAGGTFDLGTSGSQMTASSATLILAYGSSAGQYPLTVYNGGNFSVYGSAKTPSSLVTGTVTIGPGSTGLPFNVASATGWTVGDSIIIDSEAVTLTGISGNQITSIGGSLGQAHYSSNTVRVADLTRNVLIRSSGTTLSSESYISDLVQNTTSFVVAQGQLNYLGSNLIYTGAITFASGATGSISSSTIENGNQGVYTGCSGCSLANNTFYGQAYAGVSGNGSTNANVINNFFAGPIFSLSAGTNNNLNNNDFIFAQATFASETSPTVSNNTFRSGLYAATLNFSNGPNAVVTNNLIFNATQAALSVTNTPNIVFSGNSIYNITGGAALSIYATTGTVVWVGGTLGYSPTGANLSDSTGEFAISSSQLMVEGAQVNPSHYFISNLTSGSGLMSFDENFATGTVKVYGDFIVSASTLTLDYSTTTYTGALDANAQKSLYFGPANSSFNNGRSRLQIASGGGFHAVGISTASTIMTELASGGTYYTFIDSGAFIVQYASFTDMDENGIQLNGLGPFSINNSTFDYSGKGVLSTSTLFTLNSVTQSTITLTGITYGETTPNTTNYSYTILGSSIGLSWSNVGYLGLLTGNSSERSDPGNHVTWGTSSNICQLLTSVANSSWSLTSTWDQGIVPTACNPVTIATGTIVTIDISNATASTTTVKGYLQVSRTNSSTMTIVGGGMTVSSGGTFDLGTSGSPISSSIKATLILSSGTFAGQYPLTIANGGIFSVYGATKIPWTVSTSGSNVTPATTGLTVANATGWLQGDTLTIDTETVTITSVPSGNSFNISAPSLTHYSSNTIVVSDLTRNVLIRSSGTVVTTAGGNSSLIYDQTTSASNFTVNYGEFAYLGAQSGFNGSITLDYTGGSASISSSTFRQGYDGVNAFNAGTASVTLQSNTMYANLHNGADIQVAGAVVNGNASFANGSLGINFVGATANNNRVFNDSGGLNIFSNNSVVSGNVASNCVGAGIQIQANNMFVSSNTVTNSAANTAALIVANGSSSTFVSNLLTANVSVGILLQATSNNIFVDNQVYSNGSDEIDLQSGSNNNTLVSNYIGGSTNLSAGIGFLSGSNLGTVWVGGGIGYSSRSVSMPDTYTSEIAFFDHTNSDNLILKNALTATPVFQASDFAFPSTSLISYNENDNNTGAALGTVRINGDVSVVGSTMTLDYSVNSYASSYTPPNLITGAGHGITSLVTFDATTRSELITVQNNSGTSWTVIGSSSGALGTVTCAASSSCGFTSTAVNFTLNTGSTVAGTGDLLTFATEASSNDANHVKQLTFGSAATTSSSWNNNSGRSRLQIASGSGFHAVGSSSIPTMIGLAGGGTYYTFIDSGVFTVQYASFTNMDENGIQLNGLGPFSINNSTFDYSGKGVLSTSTLFTLNSVTQSTITLTGITYGETTPNTTNYSYTILGSSIGLSWSNVGYLGLLTGNSSERSDPGNHVTWGTSSNICQLLTSVANSSWSLTSTWDQGIVPTACNPVTIATGTIVTIDISNATASTTTVNGYLQASRTASSTMTIVGGGMTVSSGGTLDFGTSGSPIPSTIKATVILSLGTFGGQYPLTIANGGIFSVYGAAKTPWTLSASGSNITPATTSLTVSDATGWQQSDLITIDTETATITSVPSGNTFSITAPTFTHYSTNTVVVSDLTRSVFIRSSGTVVTTAGGNSSLIYNQTSSAANFSVSYGEFAYMGNQNGLPGAINMDYTGGAGSISSSTFRKGYEGVNVYNVGTISIMVQSNVLYANTSLGSDIETPKAIANNNVSFANSFNGLFFNGTTATGNRIFNNGTEGLSIASNNGVISGNVISNNGGAGLEIQGNNLLVSSNIVTGGGSSSDQMLIVNSSNDTFFSNTFSYGLGIGIQLQNSTNNLFLNNLSYSNSSSGLYFNLGSSNNTFIGTFIGGSTSYGAGIRLINGPTTGITWVGGGIGYSSTSVLMADSFGSEISFSDPATANSMVLKSVLVNTPLTQASDFVQTGTGLISYNENDNNVGAALGTLMVNGDALVSGSTVTLDYAANSYASTYTSPNVVTGTGHSITSLSTFDATTRSELITVQNNSGTSWTVTGSSSGALGSVTCAASSSCGFTSSVLNFTLNTGSTVAGTGDFLVLATEAASNDSNRVKRLSFGPAATASSPWNNNTGRSRLQIAAGGGLHAVGLLSSPTTVGLGTGGTYYTFIDSGAFTVQYASFTNMDESGIQLNGTGPFSINNSTFDYSGKGATSTSTLFTLNSVTQSTITLTGNYYGDTTPNTTNYSYTILGSSTGLFWTNTNYSGPLTGSSSERSDPGNHIVWNASNNTCQLLTSVASSSWSLTSTWDQGIVPTSCNPVIISTGTTVTVDTGILVASTATINGILRFTRVASSTLTIVGGNVTVNGGGTLDMGTAASPITASSATLVLAYGSAYGLTINNGGALLVYGSTASGTGSTVLIRSSGTAVAFNTAYLNNLTTYTTDFNLTQGEIAYLGVAAGSELGINFAAGAAGSIQNCLIHNIYQGLTVAGSPNLTFSGNTLYSISSSGMVINNSSGTLISNNTLYSVAQYYGIELYQSTNNSVSSNTIRNGSYGMYLTSSSSNTLVNNTIYSNTRDGITVSQSNNNSVVGSLLYSNGPSNFGSGLFISASYGNVLANNVMYNNGLYGIDEQTSSGTYVYGGSIGYTLTGSQSANSNGSLGLGGTGTSIVLQGERVYPSISNEGYSTIGIASYNQDFSTGTVRIYGDYSVSGSTLVADYASELYASGATTPILIRGVGHSVTSVTTSDANTINELITVSATSSSNWQVMGSSSGSLGSLTCSASSSCGFTSSKVNFTLNTGSTVNVADQLTMVVSAASNDAAMAKAINFGVPNSSFNHGRSRLQIGATGGFHAVGSTTAPTVITKLASGGTYYTFIDSGAYTVQYASFTYMDESGIQLNGSGPFSINNSTFDYAGSGFSPTSTLITLNGVTNSTITLVGVTYGNSSPNTANYNYTILGSSVGVFWTNQNYTGTLTGDSNERSDPSNVVNWNAAPNYYWISSGASNWNNTSNWSATSGGSVGVGVPVGGSNVYFDGNGLGNCLIDTTVNVSSMSLGNSATGNYLGSVDTSSNVITVSSFTMNSGTFSARASTMTLSSSALNAGTFNANASSITIQSSMLLSASASFNAGTSTVLFSGVAGSTQTLTGSTTFYNLTLASPGQTMQLPAGSTTTVNNVITISGSLSNRVLLRSSTPGMQTYLKDNGTNSVSFVDVMDNNAASGATMNPAPGTSTDRGNNVNWTFGTNAPFFGAEF